MDNLSVSLFVQILADCFERIFRFRNNYYYSHANDHSNDNNNTYNSNNFGFEWFLHSFSLSHGLVERCHLFEFILYAWCICLNSNWIYHTKETMEYARGSQRWVLNMIWRIRDSTLDVWTSSKNQIYDCKLWHSIMNVSIYNVSVFWKPEDTHDLKRLSWTSICRCQSTNSQKINKPPLSFQNIVSQL